MDTLTDTDNKHTFNGKNVFMVIGKVNNPYFYSNQTAEILGYSNCKKSLQICISEKYKKTLSNLSGTHFGFHINYTKGKAIFISDPGLYELIFLSKLPIDY